MTTRQLVFPFIFVSDKASSAGAPAKHGLDQILFGKVHPKLQIRPDKVNGHHGTSLQMFLQVRDNPFFGNMTNIFFSVIIFTAQQAQRIGILH